MTPGKQSDKEPLYHVLLSHDDSMDLAYEPFDKTAFVFDLLVYFLNVGGKLHTSSLRLIVDGSGEYYFGSRGYPASFQALNPP